MERETFEDEETALLLNEKFISIKVDREERPDIDSIYMSVCQMMNGHGGWPLSIFMNSDKVPFFAGTYFPKEARYGYPGFKEIIVGLSNKYNEDPEHIKEIAGNVIRALKPNNHNKDLSALLTIQAVEKAFSQYLKTFDSNFGGFGHAPKFPMPHSLTFLLRYYRFSNDERALTMVVKTLEGLARGGIYDHIGFGFSRYSVDEKFLVPHFEKMLYDNALLAIAYLETFQVTKREPFKKAAEDIFTYVLRDMQHVEGGFYSAEDADSEGEEGKFYVWTPAEIEDVLGKETGRLFCQVYDIREEGNFEGKNIPNLIKADFTKYERQGELVNKLEEARTTLFEYRNKRVHPYKDDKILTAWNGLMIVALAMGGRLIRKHEYILAAERAITFIEENLMINGRLMVRYRDGEVRNKGFIDDYAFLLWALIEMYEATLNLEYIQKAKDLTKKMIELFWDSDEGGFYFYGSDNEELLVRQKEVYDGAIPSGNSVAALQMLRLARMTGEYALEEKVQQLFKASSRQLAQYPEGHAFLLQGYLLTQMKMKEIIVVKGNEDLNELIKELQEEFHPEMTYLISDDIRKFSQIAPFTADYKQKCDKTTVYICENFICNQPTTDLIEVMKIIRNRND